MFQKKTAQQFEFKPFPTHIIFGDPEAIAFKAKNDPKYPVGHPRPRIGKTRKDHIRQGRH